MTLRDDARAGSRFDRVGKSLELLANNRVARMPTARPAATTAKMVSLGTVPRHQVSCFSRRSNEQEYL
jgi:hypothetical protein